MLLASAVLVALVAAGCTDEGRPVQMPVGNYSEETIEVVHTESDGARVTRLTGSTGYTSLGPGDHGLFAVEQAEWCSQGSFIARTPAGVEVARRTATLTTTNICGSWTIGSPPPPPSQ
jgi:hypothetical protein